MVAQILPRHRRKLVILPILVLAGLLQVEALRSQTPAPARTTHTPEERAHDLSESESFYEAAELYEAALVDHQKLLVEHPDDAAVFVAWCACRNGLADQRSKLNQFPVKAALLDETTERLQAFLAKHPEDAAARLELAHAWEQRAGRAGGMGLSEESTQHIRQALVIHRKLASERGAAPERRADLAILLTNYAGRLMVLGRYPDAIAAYEEALTVARQLTADCPDSQKGIEALALTTNSYALLVRESGQFARAADMIREAIRLVSNLETKYPDRPEFWYQLPTFYRNLSIPLTYLNNTNEVAIAKREAERLDAKLARFPEAAKKWLKDSNKMVGVFQTLDVARLSRMEAEVGSNRRTAQENLRLHPEIPLYRMQLSGAKLAEAAQLCTAQKAPEECLRLFEEASALSDKLVEQCPDVVSYRFYAANARITLGTARMCLGQQALGESTFEKGIAELQKLADAHPGEPSLRQKLLEMLLPALNAYVTAQDWNHATSLLTLIRSESKKQAEAYPACPLYRRTNIQSCEWQARLCTLRGDTAGAESAWRESMALWRRMVVDFPTNPDNRRSLGEALFHLGELLCGKDRNAELLTITAETLHLHEELVQAFPADQLYLSWVAVDNTNYAGLLEQDGKADAALGYYKVAVEKMEAAVRLNPRRRDSFASLRNLQQNLADAYLKLGKQAEYQQMLTAIKATEEYLDAPLIRIARANERFAAGNLVAALREADDLFSNCDLTASLLDDLAEFYVKAAESTMPTQDGAAHAARAVEILRRACDLGRMSFVSLDADPRFRSLVDRDDFKKLIADQRK